MNRRLKTLLIASLAFALVACDSSKPERHHVRIVQIREGGAWEPGVTTVEFEFTKVRSLLRGTDWGKVGDEFYLYCYTPSPTNVYGN